MHGVPQPNGPGSGWIGAPVLSVDPLPDIRSDEGIQKTKRGTIRVLRNSCGYRYRQGKKAHASTHMYTNTKTVTVNFYYVLRLRRRINQTIQSTPFVPIRGAVASPLTRCGVPQCPPAHSEASYIART